MKYSYVKVSCNHEYIEIAGVVHERRETFRYDKIPNISPLWQLTSRHWPSTMRRIKMHLLDKEVTLLLLTEDIKVLLIK